MRHVRPNSVSDMAPPDAGKRRHICHVSKQSTNPVHTTPIMFSAAMRTERRHAPVVRIAMWVGIADAAVHQMGSVAFNATTPRALTPSPHDEPALQLNVTASWQLDFNDGVNWRTCLAVRAANRTATLCQQCASLRSLLVHACHHLNCNLSGSQKAGGGGMQPSNSSFWASRAVSLLSRGGRLCCLQSVVRTMVFVSFAGQNASGLG